MNIDEAKHDPYKSIGVVTLKIEKFSEFAREEGKDAHRLSDPVYVRGLPWKILVMPRQIGRRDNFGNVNPKKSLGYFLQCNAENHESTWSCLASAKLKLLAQKEGKKDHIRKIGHVFHAVETDWGFAEYMKFEELMDPENGWYDKSANSITLSAEINAQIPDGLKMQSICEDMGNLFDKEDKYSDCILVSSDGTKFKAHKCILANRSLVFAAMFEHGMVEAQNGIVNIEDIQSNILKEMIRFVYNGIHPNMGEKENIAEDMLVAAEKYGLVDLKMISERNLVFFMDNENAC